MIASDKWLIISLGSLPENLPEILPDISKTNISIVEKWRNCAIMIYFNVKWEI